MARTKNAKNKPKFASVKLSDLCQLLQAETRIPVEIRFAKMLAGVNNSIQFEELQNISNITMKKQEGNKIEFKIL